MTLFLYRNLMKIFTKLYPHTKYFTKVYQINDKFANYLNK